MWNLMSLDGYIAGPGGELDWHNDVWGPEMAALSDEQGKSTGGFVFGRKTYGLMAGYWPNASDEQAETRTYMNETRKYVFSRTLKSADWTNSTLLNGDAAKEVAALKAAAAKDLYVFGSADLSAQLLPHGLFDELRIAVAPLLLGSGVPLFRPMGKRLRLKLTKSTPMQSGGMILFYDPR